ncbi:DUF3054 domain-containing protein [Terracoccus luteus]|uniref:DUF3054 family protein n=1 Tax=Terracoccus luteus TaxID=53356 RepID=A0A839Q062_9MICO|nr:DUF3054 domain-containing protein [Terracoccus luteus]MBB2987655.1 hypothetical protein [Terracoccus luteus]MCP2173306.1 hypothetical protein [Terracoccus luteus]
MSAERGAHGSVDGGSRRVLRRSPVEVTPPVALLVDVVLVVVFAAVGRASHEEGNPVLGALATAWPFLVGTLLGWAVVRVSRRQWPLGVSPGVTVWVATVLVGMVLRQATGSGTALSFVVVASVVLAVFLLGWRAVIGLLGRRSGRASRAEA